MCLKIQTAVGFGENASHAQEGQGVFSGVFSSSKPSFKSTFVASQRPRASLLGLSGDELKGRKEARGGNHDGWGRAGGEKKCTPLLTIMLGMISFGTRH